MFYTYLQKPKNKKNQNRNCLILVQSLFLISVSLFLVLYCTYNIYKNNEFDYLIFSQRWLPSACIHYEQHNSSQGLNKRHCILPQNYEIWTIHGLWPTFKKGFGPFFCNSTLHFDASKLDPIKPTLDKIWLNIETGSNNNNLWKHEWLKHGTCAVILESLNTEFKYFNKSLDFYQLHNINEIFARENISASSVYGYDIKYVFDVLYKYLGKTPHLNCITDVNTKQPYLFEVRICFDKSLQLIDCEEVNFWNLNRKSVHSSSFTNCPLDDKVTLPNSVD